MANIQFSFPKQWEDWCSWLLGIWLCISPWTIGYDLDATATHTSVITGIVIIVTELVTLSIFEAWEEWVNVILGVWLIICAWVLGISDLSVRINFVVVGALVVALALYEVRHIGAEIESEDR